MVNIGSNPISWVSHLVNAKLNYLLNSEINTYLSGGTVYTIVLETIAPRGLGVQLSP